MVDGYYCSAFQPTLALLGTATMASKGNEKKEGGECGWMKGSENETTLGINSLQFFRSALEK